MSELTNRFSLLRRLHSPADVLFFARVVTVAALVPLFTRLSLPRQAAVLSWRTPRTCRRVISRSPDVEPLARCVELAQRVLSPVVRRGCLTRGITLYWFLGRADENIELCFGVGHPDGDFGAHCWLARGGQPFLEPVDPTLSFAVIYRIPPVTGQAAGSAAPRP